MSATTKILASIILLALVGGLLFYVYTHKSIVTEIQKTGQPTDSAQNNVPPDSEKTNPDIEKLKAGGQSYMDANGFFTILYPSDYRIDTNDAVHPRLVKIGATQKGQTEIYDGVIITFETVTIPSTQTFEEWVDERIKSSISDGTISIIETKKQINLNSYPGFEYTMRGLGEFKNIIIHKDMTSKNAIVITQLVADPENKDYQKEVDTTLSTIQLLK